MTITGRGRWSSTLLDERGTLVYKNMTTDKGSSVAGEVVANSRYYLSMDGVDDYIRTPPITFDEIIMDMYVEHQAGVGKFYFDARAGFTGGYVYRETTNTDRWNTVGAVYVNGVSQTWGTVFVPDKQRVTLRTTMGLSGTDDVNIFSNSSNTQNSKGRLYSVTFKNAGVVTAFYDMTRRNVEDQSGNGKHATLFGGTWVEDSTSYYLSMDGVDDLLRSPQLTATRIVMDFVYESNPTSTLAMYLWDNRGGTPTGNYMAFMNTAGTTMTKGSNITTAILDGVVGSSWSTTTGTRYVLDCDHSATPVTSDTNGIEFFVNNGNQNTARTKGKIYNIKIYNGATLLAHYDMSLGNVLDQSGNGNHGILTGGTWIAEGLVGTVYTKSFNDSIGTSEVFAKLSGKTVSDSVIFSDTIRKSLTIAVIDTITTSESAGSMKGKALNFADSVVISDSIRKSLTKTKSDTITTSESENETTAKSFQFDVVSSSDSIVLQRGTAVSLSDSIAIVDSIRKSLTLSKSDTVVTSESEKDDITKKLNDTVAQSDFIIRKRMISVYDGVTLTDSLLKNIKQGLMDNAEFADACAIGEAHFEIKLYDVIVTEETFNARIPDSPILIGEIKLSGERVLNVYLQGKL